jgi:phospholipid/cholesterol/gamma-HCH transport system substrate-binding protein
MLSRLVRIQLVVFAVASLIGVTVMGLTYLDLPAMLGIGRITVTLELPEAGGIYKLANVTYRGTQIGKVVDVDVNRSGAVAILSLEATAKVPADLRAEVRSVSAVGEQYVDLRPRTRTPPYLRDGSVIARADTVIPQPVGPMLDHVSSLLASVPKDKLKGLLDESSAAFGGAGPDLAALLDSSSKISTDLNAAAGRATTLIEDAAPFLDAQAQSADSLRSWSTDLAGVGQQLVSNDPQLRTVLNTGPGAVDEAARLLDQIKPTLPILLANLTTLGQVLVTYRPGLEQVLVLLPPSLAFYQSSAPQNNPTGIALGDFHVEISDPPPCTVGFLPPSSWRSPADTTEVDTPDGLYCKLPQDSPIGVRGARNTPCMGVPGKSAPTVAECYSDKPYQPMAMRQHVLGPYPLDPNLIAQGIPPDDRTTVNDNIFAPPQGTPQPPGAAPGPTEAPPPDPTPSASTPMPPDGAPPTAAPSAFTPDHQAKSVAIAHYDPNTGRYATPDGQVFQQSNVAVSGAPKTWQNLVLTDTG